MKKTVYYYGGEIEYGVTITENGAYCSSVKDTKTGIGIYKGTNEIFFASVTDIATKEETALTSTEGWKSVIAAESTLVFEHNEKADGVSVIIHITGGEKLVFNTELINTDKRFSLYRAGHPALYFKADKNRKFFYPYGCGEYKPSTYKGGWYSEQSYPSYGASMQYLSFWDEKTNRGIYYGCHDTVPAPKKLVTKTIDGGKNVCLSAWQLCSDITSAGNSQKLCGSLVMKAHDGDWYDSALLYRDFIENEAEYKSIYDENGKCGVPEWFRETDCWFNTRVDGNEPFADFVIKQAKKLGVNPAIHLYYWHQIPFDNDYPHYFPMKSVVVPELKKLHDAGIKVMPYINGRLWDTRDKGAEDFEFTSVAKPWCTKDINGDPITETYSSKEEDGSKVCLSVMCPSTTLWQDKVDEIVKKLFEMGFDGVYIDQIAAAEAKPCTDPGHKHPAGGGDWWCRSYNTLLERIARHKPDDRMLTTECTADPFMRHLDGYLTWLWIKNEQVPAFPTVFSDKVITFGTDYRGLGNMDYGLNGVLDEAGVRVFAAQSFLYGVQLGWMTPQLFARMPHRDFYIHLVRERARFRRYFLSGRVLHPPVIKDNGRKIKLTKCREAYNGYVESNCVNGMLWEENKTGDKVLLIINSGNGTLKAEVKCDLPDGKYMLSGDNESEITITNGTFTAKMKGLSLSYIEVKK